MIKKAVESDYLRLIEIWESAVKATHTFLSDEDFLHIKSKLPFYFDNVSLYVYEEDTSIIKGFLGVSDDMIEMLFIENENRGKGIGKKLLKFAIDNLKLNRVDVNEQNIQALEFYKYFGFIETGYSHKDSEGRDYPIIHLQLS